MKKMREGEKRFSLLEATVCTSGFLFSSMDANVHSVSNKNT